jgi:hypothetical protein
VPFTLTSPIVLPAGTPNGIYLHSVTTGAGIRYTGTTAAPPQTTWSNADITLFSDVSRTGRSLRRNTVPAAHVLGNRPVLDHARDAAVLRRGMMDLSSPVVRNVSSGRPRPSRD